MRICSVVALVCIKFLGASSNYLNASSFITPNVCSYPYVQGYPIGEALKPGPFSPATNARHKTASQARKAALDAEKEASMAASIAASRARKAAMDAEKEASMAASIAAGRARKAATDAERAKNARHKTASQARKGAMDAEKEASMAASIAASQARKAAIDDVKGASIAASIAARNQTPTKNERVSLLQRDFEVLPTLATKHADDENSSTSKRVPPHYRCALHYVLQR